MYWNKKMWKWIKNINKKYNVQLPETKKNFICWCGEKSKKAKYKFVNWEPPMTEIQYFCSWDCFKNFMAPYFLEGEDDD